MVYFLWKEATRMMGGAIGCLSLYDDASYAFGMNVQLAAARLLRTRKILASHYRVGKFLASYGLFAYARDLIYV